jgi:hypothetical protein
MRNYGSRTGLDIKVAPDQVLTLVIGGSSGQAFDYPSRREHHPVHRVSRPPVR